MLSKTEFTSLPVFITTMSRWDGDISSASLALAKVLSRTNDVYYIDYPYSYLDAWRERRQPSVRRRMPALFRGKNYLSTITGQPDSLHCVTPKLVMPFYSLPKGRLYDLAMHHNNKLLASTVKKILLEKGLNDYVFLNSFNPSYLSQINRYLQPALSIYQSRDAIEEISAQALPRENECVQHYEVTIATSKQLCRNIAARNRNRVVTYFPNGGDAALFKTAVEKELPKPAELQNIHTPVIGYTGAVCQRIDYELLVKIARAHPDKTIVLVGPRKDKQYTDINLDGIPNIVFTGAKKIDELPAYLRCFNCAIIPFKCNNLTAGIYPLKINEYLAAGRSVVTTNFSEDIAAFGSQVYLSNSHDEFLHKLSFALTDNSDEKKAQRMKAAVANSWEIRVEKFWNLAWNAYRHKTKINEF